MYVSDPEERGDSLPKLRSPLLDIMSIAWPCSPQVFNKSLSELRHTFFF